MTSREFGKVAVLMGGPSAEREVSLKSGGAVLAALQRQGVDAHGIDADRKVVRTLEDGGFDRAFVMLHGPWGEDGVIQGALEVLGLPYTGSGVLASALGMDKLRSKRLWSCSDLPTPEYMELRSGTDPAEVLKRLGTPIAIKPNTQGSSVGICKVESANEVKVAWDAAGRYDEVVIAERWIQGKEITATILGAEVLPLIHIEVASGFYDYQAKYLATDTLYHCPAAIPDALTARICNLARTTFELLGCYGWGRVDFMVDETGEPYVLEINTVPGMTDHSLVPMAAKQAGIDFDELVMRILETSDAPGRADKTGDQKLGASNGVR